MLPHFAYHFGIRPWEIDRLTVREVSDLVTTVQQMQQNDT